MGLKLSKVFSGTLLVVDSVRHGLESKNGTRECNHFYSSNVEIHQSIHFSSLLQPSCTLQGVVAHQPTMDHGSVFELLLHLVQVARH